MLVSFFVTAVSLAALFLAAYSGYGEYAGFFKMAASCGFISLALFAGALRSLYGKLILAALFFSWWGDFFLIFSGSTFFLLGLVSFFLGHVAYAAAFAAHGVSGKATLITLAAVLVPALIVVRWLEPGLGDMRYPVYAYITVITIMVALSGGAVARGATVLVFVGALLFYCSDVFVARQRFVVDSDWNRVMGLPLYYLAQVVMAYTIALVNPKTPTLEGAN